MGDDGYLVGLSELLVGCLGYSVLKVDIYGAVKKKRATSGFGLQVIFRGIICVSGPCTLYLYCGTISNLA